MQSIRMQSVVTDAVWSVSLCVSLCLSVCVCLLVVSISCAKIAESIEVLLACDLSVPKEPCSY